MIFNGWLIITTETYLIIKIITLTFGEDDAKATGL